MTTEADKLVVFRLGEDLFAADIFSVERVLRYVAPTPVPDMPAYIEGVMDYQGHVVPVVNLRLRFELPAASTGGETRTLVLNVAGEWIGVVVDAVTEVAAYDRGAVSAPPKLFRGLSAEYLKGIVRRGERLVIFLDVAQLLSSTERISLAEAGARELAHG
ncbi:MAG: purine-binding chemotaxis protein CheW [Gemmatimonadaceae bacterium]|nr:purine-binding chemotaxis protein CheW [Gemmatimonadaceae bacterium]NUO94035.1 purine-binding chemotaxis protein CheW [Gemmatimonadaceae bacterium]NUP72579.1 purine-binding chemotaxis protein CheW [Gemmatimonadaceae bacterium]NUR32677.1 purine-binding chemotaxis protein CheW [Gemmatimonadaceae bacterium]NUS34698.1 purine-binding chemotaxis protein CheW [Gemmatimonadaceae bacterium]